MTVLPLVTSKNRELRTSEGACLSHRPVWLAAKEKNLHVGEGREAGWDNRKI
uniref:Uncharacterized protein n=1 Tax=Suricata suricatta TaxID=37032 RepID=A0A673TLW0_SURSU